jgi:Flp pilus assembly protein TadG
MLDQLAFPRRASFIAPLIYRFIRRDEATTTIEFGLLVAPFIAALFAILQTALVFFAGQTLETAAAASARLVFTGQAQTNGWKRRAVQAAGLQSNPRRFQL